MALRKVRSNIDRFFDKSLTDLIRGIRNNKENEARYIASCIDEIKLELRHESSFVKANAIEKLAYLQMMGYDISWAAFNVIEVMASTKFTEKRIGYLTAAQCFHDETDVLMLTTNLIRKDLHAGGLYDSGVALGGLACFVTTDLSRDLAPDIVNLLTSSRPYIRKRAVLLLYKIFLKFPDSLRPTFPRLKEKLEDPDPGVQCAAVNVICELARKNPKNYLTLSPVFFKLMTTSSNNWMLIKIIKLFGALVPLEPRLGKKLLEPLTNLINSTSAMSLLYECINTVIAVLISVSSGAPGDHTASIQLCVQKLGVLIEDADQNLKYLGLLAMGRILQTHPKAVQAHKDIVMRCLDDKDESIRLRALDLLYGMVSKKNIMEIVRRLMEHVDAAEGSHYRDELLSRIISICSCNNYQYITNFEWYISVLVELTKVEGTKHGASIAQQMQDVTVRVQSIRHFSVGQMALLVENAHLLLGGSVQQRSNIAEVLHAAAWICGEYAEHVRNVQSVLEAMLKAKPNVMPGHILSIYVQAIAKLYSALLTQAEKDDDWDRVESLDNLMLSKLPEFESADHLEAQERACALVAMLRCVEKMHGKREKIAEDVAALFDGELNPVAAKAQRKVPVPAGLDLDAWINEPPPLSEPEEEEDEDDERPGDAPAPTYRSEFLGFGGPPKFDENEEAKKKNGGKVEQVSSEEMEKRRKRREAEIANNPYYVKGSSRAGPATTTTSTIGARQRPTKIASNAQFAEQSEKTPLDLQSPLEIPGVVGLNRYMEQQESTLQWKNAKKEKKTKVKSGKRAGGKSGKGKRAQTASESEEEDVQVVHEVNRGDGEMPEDAKSTDEDDVEQKTVFDEHRALDVDLDAPLRADERITAPVNPYARPSASAANALDTTRHAREEQRGYNGREYGEVTEKKEGGKKTKKKKTGDGEKKTKKHATKVADSGMDEAARAKVERVAEARADTSSHAGGGGNATHEVLTAKRSGGKKKKRVAPPHAADASPVDKDVYEEPSGVCTPTNPNLRSESSNGVASAANATSTSTTPKRTGIAQGQMSTATKFSAYRLLGENERVKLTYETRVSTDDAHQVAVGVVFMNKSSDTTMRNLQMNILDTLNTRLLREPGASAMNAIALPFQLPSGVANEQMFRFSVEAINVSQKLRGSFTYFVDIDGRAVEEKVDFHLRLACSSFTLPATINSDAFTQLLAGDDLDVSASTQLKSELPWAELLRKICFFGHFSVVDQTENSASLYSHTIKAEPICILMKMQGGNRVTVDGKSSDQQLISAIVDEIREIALTF